MIQAVLGDSSDSGWNGRCLGVRTNVLIVIALSSTLQYKNRVAAVLNELARQSESGRLVQDSGQRMQNGTIHGHTPAPASPHVSTASQIKQRSSRTDYNEVILLRRHLVCGRAHDASIRTKNTVDGCGVCDRRYAVFRRLDLLCRRTFQN